MKCALWSFFFVFCYVCRFSFSFFFIIIIGKLRDSATGNVLFFFSLLLYFLTIWELFLFSFSLVYFVNENMGLLITRKQMQLRFINCVVSIQNCTA